MGSEAGMPKGEWAAGLPEGKRPPARISVSGAGYVGLVTAACLAELGHEVSCVEIEPGRLEALLRGQLPIFEPQLDAIISKNLDNGTLRFTGEYPEALHGAKYAFVAVQTPPAADGSADTRYVFECVESILDHAQHGLIVVVKSTVPVGTGDRISALLSERGRDDIQVVSNPEFLRQGSAVLDFMQPDRVVVGSTAPEAAQAVASLYATLEAPLVLCNRRSAELAKYGANALLATRISFMNELANICEEVSADIEEVAEVMKLDPRIGPYYLRAGLGWGGSCFPKDVLALSSLARSVQRKTPIIDAAFEVNQGQRDEIYTKVRRNLNGSEEPVVAVLGLAFKPNTDDLRQSPAMDIIERLLKDGVRIRAHDPVAVEKAARALEGPFYCSNAGEALQGADVALLATEWLDYKDIDWTAAAYSMRNKVVVDGRNYLDGRALAEQGFNYLAVGRSSEQSPAPELV